MKRADTKFKAGAGLPFCAGNFIFPDSKKLLSDYNNYVAVMRFRESMPGAQKGKNPPMRFLSLTTGNF